MNFILINALQEHKNVIENLMQFYMYDFSEYTNSDSEKNGVFAAGFVLIKFIESKERNYFSIAEFFIMKKCRRAGIG